MATEAVAPGRGTPPSTARERAPSRRSRAARRERAEATALLLERIERTRTWIPAWRRAMDAIERATHKRVPGSVIREIQDATDLRTARDPGRTAADLAARMAGASPQRLVGSHVEHLVVALREAEDHWSHLAPARRRTAGTVDVRDVGRTAAAASAALQRALQHALFYMYLQKVCDARVGQRIEFDDAIDGWGLSAAQVDEVWSWIRHDADMTRFDNRCLPVLIDPRGRSAYRIPRTRLEKVATVTAPVWGAAVALGAIIGVFALLDRAGLTDPPSDWFVKLVVLYLFVLGGALVHVASMSLGNIRFEDPLQVYAASSGLTWLALRWVSVLRLYIPIAVVAGSLWGAGNVPQTFQDLGVAILAGYSADSLFRVSLSRLQAQAPQQGATPSARPTAVP